MITPDFSKRKDQSLCEYLYGYIKESILLGKLTADERLPSKRSLAMHLGISVITVQNAYALLISEGYIYSVEKKGFFVTPLNLKNVSILNKPLQCEKKSEDIPPKKSEEDFFVDFTSNTISAEKFPFMQWSKILRKILYTQSERILQKQNAAGLIELQTSIADFLREYRSINVSPEQIIIGAGTENLYSIAVSLFSKKSTVAVENPGYKKVSKILSLNGTKFIPINMDAFGIEISSLEKSKANIAHVSPSHHFPTGSVMSIKRRMELLEWAYKKSDRFILEDDYDVEFRFAGKVLSPLMNADTKGRVIYMNTFSKTLSPSFRISYMVLPPALVKTFYEKLNFTTCQVSALEQLALSDFISQGFYEKHLNRMKNFYRGLRNTLISDIQKSPLKQYCTIYEEEAGLHFLMKLKTKKSGAALKKSLEKNGIKIYSLYDFCYNEAELKNSSELQKTFIINYTGLEKSKINKAISAILNSI